MNTQPPQFHDKPASLQFDDKPASLVPPPAAPPSAGNAPAAAPPVAVAPVAAGLASRTGLGIGVITYNRRETLKGTLAAIAQHTQAPYSLVIADDGSTDGSAAWCRENGYPVMSGPNGGPGINKNRALFYLLTQTLCDPILLLEEDFRPIADGWEERWMEAATLWHHVNVFLPEWDAWLTDEQKAGRTGAALNPMWWSGFTGQCTVVSRAALEKVGYIDPLLRGFGEEHVEWTRRFGRLLHWPTEGPNEWHNSPVPQVPQIYAPDMTMVDAGTYFDAEQTRTNKDIHELIKDGPVYSTPFRTPKERQELALALAECVTNAEYAPLAERK